MAMEKIDENRVEIITPPMDVNQAHAEIQWQRSKIMSMGANDSENKTIDLIVDQLLKREITPLEAVAVARSVLDGKLDYH